MHTSTTRKIQILHYVLFVLILLSFAFDVSAQTFPDRYQSLVALPQLNNQGQGLADYFNQLYMVAVAIGAILAFIKISIAGVKWSMSEIITDKSDAKKDIQGALLGLAILLIPFIVLNTIYSGLTNLNILENASRVMIRPPSSLSGPQQNTNNNSGTPRNTDGTVNGNVTRSACNARATAANGIAVFTVLYTAGSVDYGTCVINPRPAPAPGTEPVPGTEAPLRLLRTQGPGQTTATCNNLAQLLRVPPVTYTEARFNQSTTVCQVYGRP